MTIAASELLNTEAARPRLLALPRARVLRLGALSAILLLAAGLRLANLPALGYANHYYTAVVVATDRNNTIDSTLILTLLLAAWAFSRATERGRARFVLLGAGLVGLGFNIKMLEAFLPLPAFYAMYLLGSSERLWRKCAN